MRFLVILLTLLLAAPAWGAVRVWTNAAEDRDATNAANWDDGMGGVPGDGDTIDSSTLASPTTPLPAASSYGGEIRRAPTSASRT